MAGNRLGCVSELQCRITSRCGGPTICDLGDIAEVEWNRIMDDISEARITVPVGGGSSGTSSCCKCLPDVWPWCGEAHIFRNGTEVWCGPVTKVSYQRDTVLIEAKDVLGWLLKRVPPGVLDNTKVVGGNEITDLALDVLDAAFAEDDPCVLEFVVQTDTSIRPTLFANTTVGPEQFPAFQGTYFDWLTDLSNIGLDFTTIGRRVVLSVEASTEKVVGTLTDQHLLSDVTIIKDGSLVANRVYMRYQGDDTAAQCAVNCAAGAGLQPTTLSTEKVYPQVFTGTGVLPVSNTASFPDAGTLTAEPFTMTYTGKTAGSFTGVTSSPTLLDFSLPVGTTITGAAQCPACNSDLSNEPCYVVPCPSISEDAAGDRICGLTEAVHTDSVGFNLTTAKQAGDAYQKAGRTPPLILEFPEGAHLSPDFPMDINELVPGYLIRVLLTDLCFPVSSTFKILEVKYRLGTEGNEQISLTLGPLNVPLGTQ